MRHEPWDDSGELLISEPYSPIIPGHEVIGKVVAVGPGDKSLYKIGDRIGGGWHGGHDGSPLRCSSKDQTTHEELVGHCDGWGTSN